MFGFKRRASERAAHNAAVLATVSAAVHAQLTSEIAATLASSIAEPSTTQLDADRYALNAAAMQKGVDTVLVEGTDTFGPDLARADHPTRCGAMEAHAARNMALVTHTLDNPQTSHETHRTIRSGRAMPQLPSGLNLAISRDALFDHGGNWFECPEEHFWYWVPAPEMGSAPFDPDAEIMQVAEHAAVPKDREEAKRLIRVLEMRNDGKLVWRGEWLSSFPLYTKLSIDDLAAWNAWITRPEIDEFLDDTIAECKRLSEMSRNAQGYAVAVGTGEPDENGWVQANLRIPNDTMHDIEMHVASEEFTRCWQAAGRHIQAQVQGPFHSWLKANLNPPFLEHLSFRLGNQLFFIRVEDVDGRLDVPGGRDGLLSIAEGCKGHACIMPMHYRAGAWAPDTAGWGLVDARTESTVDPIVLVSDERIEMTDWELQDFAVQIVRDHLEKAGRKLMSWQGNPAVNPSIWFVGDSGPEWVVVRAVRYPRTRAVPPQNWEQIAERCAKQGKVGYFASVSVANASDNVDPTGAVQAEPLWRGHRMRARFEGLIAGSLLKTASAEI